MAPVTRRPVPRRIVAGCRNGALMKRPATMFDRDVALSKLTEEIFDVVVVAEGSPEPASRWTRLERAENRSRGERRLCIRTPQVSKMVHGGLRYLQQHDSASSVRASMSVVSCCRTHTSRRASYAPYSDFRRSGSSTGPQQGVLDSVVDVRPCRWLADWQAPPPHHRSGARSHFPTLRTDRLVAGSSTTTPGRRRPADSAVLRTAVLEHAAVAVNYTPVVGLVHDDASHLTGVRVAPLSELAR